MSMKQLTIKTLVFSTLLLTSFYTHGQNLTKAAGEMLLKDGATSALERNVARKVMFAWPDEVKSAYTTTTQEAIIAKQFQQQHIPYMTQSQLTVLHLQRITSKFDPAQADELRSLQLKVTNSAKLILEQNAKEDAFYLPEIENAQKFLAGIEEAKAVGLEVSADLFAPYLSQIPNKRLFFFLQDAIEKADYDLMQQELREFYSIGMTNAKAAANYAARHPHEPNLFVKRFLKAAEGTPLSHLSVPIKISLEKEELASIDKAMYEISVAEADKAYHNVMSVFAKDALVAEQISYYKNFLSRFEEFLKEYGRLPKHNSTFGYEKHLAAEFTFVKQSIETNNFPPRSDYIQKAKDLAAPYEK